MYEIPPPRSDGAITGTREKLPWPSNKPFRILAIDGGGIRGIYPAAFLAELEQNFLGGRSVGEYFDLIAGTSTGGIIALGLGKGLTAADITQMYLRNGERIFPAYGKIGQSLRYVRRLFSSGYDVENLRRELQTVLQETRLGESRIRLCIPAFEGIYGEPWIYKTPHHPDYSRDKTTDMVTVGIATAAAPTYLRALEDNGYVMVDGGLVANNPIMVAIVDALACHKVDRCQIQVLSIGCGSKSFEVSKRQRSGGLWHWKEAVVAAMNASSANALGQACLLIGADHVIRIEPSEGANIKLDDVVEAKRALPNAAKKDVEKIGQTVAAKFFTKPAGHLTTYAPYLPR